MNRGDLESAVRYRLGVPTGDSFNTDTVIDELLGEALYAVSAEAQWPWLQGSATITTAAGTASYAVPADWYRTRTLVIDTKGPSLELRQIRDIDDVYSTDRGLPCWYTIEGDQVVLRPTPDGVYSITHRYQKVEPALTADSGAGSTPLMPAQYHHAIVQYAVWQSFLRANQGARAQAAFVAYQGWLKRMHDDRRRTSASPRIRVRPGGWFG